ncbi:MAG TPA: flagellar biosynthetic protein FliR [bacterium]|jgi:flagellar biosynthetic protein FliR
MPDIFSILELYFIGFLVVLVRMSAFFITAPVFGGTGVPTAGKIGLASIISMMLNVTHGPLPIDTPSSVLALLVLVAAEVAFGLTLGYAVSLVFAGVQLGGMLMGYQMGFAVANVLDPVSNNQVSIIGQFLFLFALLYFLAMDAHHVLIKGLSDSLILAPPGSFSVDQESVSWMVGIFTQMFWLGLKISMPVVGAIFLVDVALGIVAKTVPQMNVFIVGLPLKSLLGMLILALAYPFFALVMRLDFQAVMDGFYGMMGWLS